MSARRPAYAGASFRGTNLSASTAWVAELDVAGLLQTRVLRMRRYHSTFVGSEFVTWLVESGRCSNRVAATQLGEKLRQRDMLHHVLDQHKFKDEQLYYRMRGSEKPGDAPDGPCVAQLMSQSRYMLAGWFLKQGTMFLNRRYFVLDRLSRRLYVFTSDISASPRYSLDFAETWCSVAPIRSVSVQSRRSASSKSARSRRDRDRDRDRDITPPVSPHRATAVKLIGGASVPKPVVSSGTGSGSGGSSPGTPRLLRGFGGGSSPAPAPAPAPKVPTSPARPRVSRRSPVISRGPDGRLVKYSYRHAASSDSESTDDDTDTDEDLSGRTGSRGRRRDSPHGFSLEIKGNGIHVIAYGATRKQQVVWIKALRCSVEGKMPSRRLSHSQLRLHGLDPAVSSALTSPIKYDPYVLTTPSEYPRHQGGREPGGGSGSSSGGGGGGGGGGLSSGGGTPGGRRFSPAIGPSSPALRSSSTPTTANTISPAKPPLRGPQSPTPGRNIEMSALGAAGPESSIEAWLEPTGLGMLYADTLSFFFSALGDQQRQLCSSDLDDMAIFIPVHRRVLLALPAPPSAWGAQADALSPGGDPGVRFASNHSPSSGEPRPDPTVASFRHVDDEMAALELAPPATAPAGSRSGGGGTGTGGGSGGGRRSRDSSPAARRPTTHVLSKSRSSTEALASSTAKPILASMEAPETSSATTLAESGVLDGGVLPTKPASPGRMHRATSASSSSSSMPPRPPSRSESGTSTTFSLPPRARFDIHRAKVMLEIASSFAEYLSDSGLGVPLECFAQTQVVVPDVPKYVGDGTQVVWRRESSGASSVMCADDAPSDTVESTDDECGSESESDGSHHRRRTGGGEGGSDVVDFLSITSVGQQGLARESFAELTGMALGCDWKHLYPSARTVRSGERYGTGEVDGSLCMAWALALFDERCSCRDAEDAADAAYSAPPIVAQSAALSSTGGAGTGGGTTASRMRHTLADDNEGAIDEGLRQQRAQTLSCIFKQHLVRVLQWGAHPLSCLTQRLCCAIQALYGPLGMHRYSLSPDKALDYCLRDLKSTLARLQVMLRDLPLQWLSSMNDWGSTMNLVSVPDSFPPGRTAARSRTHSRSSPGLSGDGPPPPPLSASSRPSSPGSGGTRSSSPSSELVAPTPAGTPFVVGSPVPGSSPPPAATTPSPVRDGGPGVGTNADPDDTVPLHRRWYHMAATRDEADPLPPSPPSSPFSPPPRPSRRRSGSVVELWGKATRMAAAIELSEDMLDEMCAEALRRVVFAAIGDTVLGMYRPVYVADDHRLRRIQRALWGVTCHQLKVDRNLCLDAAPPRIPGDPPPPPTAPFWHVFQAATNALSSMVGYPSPDEKRDAMVATVRSLFACVKAFHAATLRAAGGGGGGGGGGDGDDRPGAAAAAAATSIRRRQSMQISADNLLGLFCHLIIHSEVRDLFAEMAYVYTFMSSSDRMARPGFYYTTIQSAMAYLTSDEVDITPMCGYCERHDPTVRCQTCHRLYCDDCDVFVHGSPAQDDDGDTIPAELRPITRDHIRRRLVSTVVVEEEGEDEEEDEDEDEDGVPGSTGAVADRFAARARVPSPLSLPDIAE